MNTNCSKEALYNESKDYRMDTKDEGETRYIYT